ncbi:MAG: S-layer homology domain-containing protein [Clostridia bacterium]|nr:S-layer homology domain-containing protein [Clostridia bacterium]
MKEVKIKRNLSIFIVVLMIMNLFMVSLPGYAGSPVSIAEWNFTSAPASASILATGGAQSSGASLTNKMGNTPSYTSSNSTIYTNGWDNGANSKYWEFSVSTTGYSGIAFSAKAYSTSTGPRDFEIRYSTDGAIWTSVAGSARQLTSALPGAPTWDAVALPSASDNQSDLKIRLIMTSNTSQNGGTVASTGNSRLAAISITGMAMGGGSAGPDITHTPVTAGITNSDILIPAQITSTSTVTAAVYYGSGADGNTFSNFVPMSNTTGSSFEAVIANPPAGDLYYYIKATNAEGQTATYPSDITSSCRITVKNPISIATARTYPVDTVVTVAGIVTYIDGSNYYIQDSTAAIDLYKSGLSLMVGDHVSVTGKIAKYNELLEVVPVNASDVAVLSKGNPLPPARLITLPEINSDVESQLVKLKNLTLGPINTGGNTPVSDSLSNTINIYKIPSLTGISEGDTVDITAIVSRYNAFQLRVRSAADVVLTDLGPDTEPPVITHTAITSGNTDVDIVVTASITDNRKSVYQKVYYRTTGQTGYTAISMTKLTGSTYTATVPKSALSTAGLQYYIETSDGTNIVTLPANKEVPYSVAISAADITGPVVANITPANGSSTESNLRPSISASYSDPSGINTGSVKLFLDGTDVTAAATVTAGGITCIPSSDLSRTSHLVELRVSDTAGNQTVSTWSFSSGTQTYEKDGDTGTAAKWELSSGGSFTQPISATGGDYSSMSGLSCWFGTSNPALNFASGGANCTGWDNGANTKYWRIQTSTKGMSDLSLFWRMRSSSTGPKNFKVQYSLDSTTWTDVPNSSIAVPNAGSITADTNLFSASLPNGAENKETLYIRWIMTSNDSAGGATVGSGGTHQINNIILNGAYLVGDNQVRAVTASVTGGGIPLQSAVTFSSATSGALIKYSTDGGNTYTTAENGQVIMNTLPATLNVKAVKSGMYDSRVKTFTFTQAKISPVASSHTAGAIPSNSVITLTAAPADATIKYILAKKAGTPNETVMPEATYTSPIALSEEMFPVRITACASKQNYISSDSVTFNYTAQKATGGERNYFGQIHSHTTNSDGAGTLEEAFAWARDNAKLDFFAVTDHSNSFDTAPAGDKAGTYNLGAYNSGNARWQAGKNAAASAAVPGKFVSFYGFEMTWSGGPGHINTFATEGFVSRNNTELNNKTNDAGLKAYYNLLKLHPESISQFNHPGTTFGNFSGFAYYDPIVDERITLIEVGNGEGAIGSGGYFPSYEQYDMALDKGWHLAPTNNQDNHKAKWGNANTARTVVYTNDFTTEGIYQALKEMRVYATEDANLDIIYTLNGEKLGTIINTVPTSAAFRVDARNMSGSNKVKSISIITNGGVEAYKQTFNTKDATLDYVMPSPKAGYYYIKVVQQDGRIAVTAPVWLGKGDSVGISEVTASTSTPVTTEPMTITTEIFNNETQAVTLNSIKYEIKGGAVIEDKALNTSIAASSGLKDIQSFTPAQAQKTTILVTAKITVNGTVKTFTREIDLNVKDINKLKFIAIDASHLNEYVAGNYKDSMGNFSTIAMQYGLRTVIVRTSEEFIAAAADPKYQMFIITAPTRRLDPATGITHKSYSQAELDAIAAFARQGKTVVITGWGDYYESYSYVTKDQEHHMAAQQNKLLQAIGSSLRLSDDEAKDDSKNGGQPHRLYLDDYNGKVSPLLEGIIEGQVFSHYGGCTVYAVNSDGTPAIALPGSVIPVISGHSTTYSSDDDKDGFGFADKTAKPPRYGNSPDAGKGAGKVLLTASETVSYGNGITAKVILSGGAFMSNFEIKNTAPDNPADAYSNENIVRNLLASIENVSITPIADIKAAQGSEFTIEGIASVGVYDGSSNNNTGFFDSIYVQDATGGINLFPVSSGVKAGQKIRVTGVVSSYQGETQLCVRSIRVLDQSITPIAPKVVSTKNATDAANTGTLIKTTGVVKRVVTEPNGTVNEITIDDGSGPVIVYINAYITPSKSLSHVTAGATISVTGLGSIGENFTSTTQFLPRIRVRDRGEIVLVEKPVTQDSNDTKGSDNTKTTGISPVANPGTKELTPQLGADGVARAAVPAEDVNALVQQAVASAAAIKINAPAPKGAKSVVVSLPSTAFIEAAKTNSTRVTIDTGFAAITFDKQAVASISQAGNKGEVNLFVTALKPETLEQEVKKIVGDRPVFELSVNNEGNKVSSFNGGKAFVSIPYNLKAGEDPDSIVLLHISNTGKTESVRSLYNKNTKCIEAVLSHFSVYAVAYNKATFNDVQPDAWYSKAVGFIASRGISTGTGNGNFSPSQRLTREQFLVMLMKAYCIAPDAIAQNSFDDVGNNYASAYISAAKRLSISSGVGGNKFAPQKEISRQEMFVMLYNALKAINEVPTVKAGLSVKVYNDLTDVAPWALPAMTLMVESGLSSGTGSNKLSPMAISDRATAAQIIYNILK